jgi:hypothetical protein
MLKKELADLGPRGAAWATAFADRLLSVFAADQPAAERSNMRGIPVELARAAFVSLVRAGVAMKPEWDILLPIPPWIAPEERARSIAAIPQARRDAALGHALSAAEIFAEDESAEERIMPSLTELILLVDDKGKPAYDAWLYMGDSGSIFKAGTTKRIAEIIQGSLECKPLTLHLALKDAFAEAAKAKKSSAR